MRRFNVGDLARVKYVRAGRNDFWHEGIVVEIIEVKPTTTDFDGQSYDYVVRMFNGGKAFPVDAQLEKYKKDSMCTRTTEQASYNATI